MLILHPGAEMAGQESETQLVIATKLFALLAKISPTMPESSEIDGRYLLILKYTKAHCKHHAGKRAKEQRWWKTLSDY